MSRVSPRHLYFAGAALLLAAFSYVVVLSNHDDWDFFFSTFEVDLRSWLIDHKAPLWSYQLCAGSTRIGDPQAFGLSPLFLPILVLGSFWGAKALVLSCCALGYFSLSRLLAMFASQGEDPDPELRLACASLALFVITGNYLLCHLFAGQLTFALFPFTFFIAYLGAQLCVSGFRAITAVGLFLAAFSYLSGGLYHSLVFFVVPAGLSATLAAAIFAFRAKIRPSRELWLRGGIVLALLALATAAASYKLIGVMHYQRDFSRDSFPGADTNSLSHMLLYFFLPTINFRFGGIVDSLDSWGPFEFSAFSFIPWAFVFALAWLAREKTKRRVLSYRALYLPELSAAALLALLFCLGDSAPISPHKILNVLLYQGSVRVVGRYHLLLTLLGALFLARLLYVSPAFRGFYLRKLLPFGIVFHLISIATFFPLTDRKRFSDYASLPLGGGPTMETLVRIPPRILGERVESFMYPAVRLGGIVLNCYQAIKRETRIATETEVAKGVFPLEERVTNVFEVSAGPQSEACAKSVAVRQNEIFYDAGSCSAGLCFKLNMKNPYIASNLSFDGSRRMFCAQASK